MGNKIYHLPGMEDYESTVIDLTKGERWLCTESEAIANGWRKAPR
ncbi:sunset domain-containing protein [Leptolyngbya sp. Heron Island J]